MSNIQISPEEINNLILLSREIIGNSHNSSGYWLFNFSTSFFLGLGIFLIGQSILRLVIEPLVVFREAIANIRFILNHYAQDIHTNKFLYIEKDAPPDAKKTNEEANTQLNKTSNIIRESGFDFSRKMNLLYCHEFFASLGFIPIKDQCFGITAEMTLLSNTISKNSENGFESVDNTVGRIVALLKSEPFVIPFLRVKIKKLWQHLICFLGRVKNYSL